jgi:uncharacterized membrane protein YagU involved in acid resistance
VRWIVIGGLAAGLLDISFACIYWALARDVPPQRIFQSVASGLLGKEGYAGGWGTAALGLALHFAMTLAMAAAYYLVSRRATVLWRRPVASGAAYGLFLYAFMNFIVVPLSRAAAGGPRNDLWTWSGVAAHVFLVGIPIALAIRRARIAEPSKG